MKRAALIVAKPGALRDGLRALLMAISGIEQVEEVVSMTTALKALPELRPTLLVAEASALDSTSLQQIGRLSPNTQRMVLVDTVKEQRQMEATGAEAVLLQGAPASELVATVERLVQTQEEVL